MPWVYIGTSPLKCAYVWTTPVKCIYVWTTKVRPSWPSIDFLLIWGGWGGGTSGCYRNWAWWWGAGWVIYCLWYSVDKWAYCVIIGSWWVTCSGGNRRWTQWWNSEWNWLVAYWGGWWWAWNTSADISWGGDGWSWGWSWSRYAREWWKGCEWQWNDGGASEYRRSGWWGGYSSAWCKGGAQYYGWNWGDWLETDITGKVECFAWWWGWGAYRYWGVNSYWWWGWGGDCSWHVSGCPWTTCWSGWWGAQANSPWAWAWWVFIVRYACGTVNVTWWDCCYLCNWYCIHCFTSNGTLTVS